MSSASSPTATARSSATFANASAQNRSHQKKYSRKVYRCTNVSVENATKDIKSSRCGSKRATSSTRAVSPAKEPRVEDSDSNSHRNANERALTIETTQAAAVAIVVGPSPCPPRTHEAHHACNNSTSLLSSIYSIGEDPPSPAAQESERKTSGDISQVLSHESYMSASLESCGHTNSPSALSPPSSLQRSAVLTTGRMSKCKRRIMQTMSCPAFDMSLIEETRGEDMLAEVCNAAQCHPLSKINDLLYLGTWKDAADGPLLKSYEITHVLNVAKEVDPQAEHNQHYVGIVSETIPMSDCHAQDLEDNFDAAFKFIEQARAQHAKVLVHCRRGISRSAAIVVAYLMASEGWTYPTALEHVQARRSCVSLNLAFQEILSDYKPDGLLWRRKAVNSSQWPHPNDLTTPDTLLPSSGESRHSRPSTCSVHGGAAGVCPCGQRICLCGSTKLLALQLPISRFVEKRRPASFGFSGSSEDDEELCCEDVLLGTGSPPQFVGVRPSLFSSTSCSSAFGHEKGNVNDLDHEETCMSQPSMSQLVSAVPPPPHAVNDIYATTNGQQQNSATTAALSGFEKALQPSSWRRRCSSTVDAFSSTASIPMMGSTNNSHSHPCASGDGGGQSTFRHQPVIADLQPVMLETGACEVK